MRIIFTYLFISLLILFSQSSYGQLSGDWKITGPVQFPTNASGQIHGIGRVSQIKFHPSNSQKMYAVSASGGLWISLNAASTWSQLNTDNFPRTSCASVCIDYTNDNIIYLGTGDANYYGNGYGIWKTTNGGASWSQSNGGIGNRLPIEIVMDPTNHNNLIAATNDGIWKSTDAGANWTVKKSGGDFKDMIFKPVANSSTIYAATSSQFWISTNMGDTWTQISLPGSGISGGGRIAVSKANSNLVYLTFVGNFSGGTATPVLKSTNSGQSFSIVRTASSTNMNGYSPTENGQGNYNYSITADPSNANIVYIVGHVVWKSTDGGVNWTKLTDWYAKIHTDMHDVEVSPYDGTRLFDANDGGLWLSTDGGNNWTPKSDGLSATENYHGVQSPIRKDMIYTGTQDNGELYFSNSTWYCNRGGDWNCKMGMDYQNTTLSYYFMNGKRRSFSQGEQSLGFPFTPSNNTEMEFTPLQTNTAFVGQNDVWRTTNLSTNPPSWTKITNVNQQVKGLTLSPVNANVLYVVTNTNQVYRSDNALSASPTFTTLTAPASTGTRASIAVIKTNPDIVYITCGSKVYRSTNKGASWTDVSGNLPNVNIIKIQHDIYSNDESVYVGMATGVYYKNNTMSNWVNYSKNLPTIANINDLMIFNDGTNNSVLRVAYYGRGVWESPLNPKGGTLRDPENPALTVSGLDYSYYEGSWSNLPDFSTLTPVKTGSVNNYDITVRNRDDQFAFKYMGYVNIPTDGQYTFYTSSDDGSKLFIGSTLVVNNDGLHGAVEQSGTIGLKAGKHAITVTFFEQGGGEALNVSYSSSTITKQAIPSSALYRITPQLSCSGTGNILREQWNGISGNEVSLIPLSSSPSSTSQLTIFEGPTDIADNYGSRIRGYICPPYTGNYTFWIASDDNSELWLSTNANPSNKVKIASVGGWTAPRSWDEDPLQKSALKSLIAGQKYYIEVLHKEGGGGDHVAVGWQLPEGTMERPIPGNRLSPFVPNVAPTVNITSPANNATYTAPANITINANAADTDGNVSLIEFYNGTTLIGSDNTSPYSFVWNNVAAGSYTLTAKATDNQGAPTTSSAINITVVAPVTTATIYQDCNFNLTGYAIGLNVGDYTTAQLVAKGIQDNDVSSLKVQNGFEIVLYDLDNFQGASQVFQGDVSCLVANGINDWAGSLKVRAIVVNQKPLVNLTAPANNSTFTAPATFTITATATDNDGTVSKVEFFNGAAKLGEDLSSPYAFTWSSVAAGSYTITAKATDNSGETTTSTAFTITVNPPNNIPPTVNITSPANNQTFTAPAGITINANATDSDGTISKVEFYQGSTKLGEDITSPYSYSWANIAAGTYVLTVKAFDNSTASTVSSAISITVNPAPNNPPTVSISSPATGTSFTEGTAITIAANAADADGSVAKVEFFRDGIKISEDLTSPFSISWTGATPATYSLTAKATDDKGAATTSASVSITVKANTNTCSGIPAYQENNGYVDGSKVTNSGSQYQCKPWPYSGWCNGAAWAYAPGTGTYWQDAWTLIGSCTSTPSTPSMTSAATNSPNPFTGSTSIEFNLEQEGNVNVAIFDNQGNKIAQVYNGYLPSGEHTVDFSGANLASGTYICKIQSEKTIKTITMVKLARPAKAN